MTIPEIQELEDGMHVDRIEGNLVRIYTKEEKEGKKGPYTIQHGEIQENGNSIRATFWNHPDLSKYKWQNIICRSVAPKSFITVSHYKDKAQISVPGKAVVLSDTEASDDIPMEYGRESSKSPESPLKPNVERKNAIPEDGVQFVRKRVMQLANLREICDNAAGFLYPQCEKEFVKEIATSLYIQATRENLHDKLPNNKPIDKNLSSDVKNVVEDLSKKEDCPF